MGTSEVLPERPRPLRNRADAGRRLAERLERYRGERPAVVALPRGGVPVGAEIARALGAPLDVLIVRKVGAPGNPEYGLGAVAEDGALVMDDARIREAGYSRADLEPTVEEERAEVARRALVYRGGRPPLDLHDRTVILVDDGVATGVTVRTAAMSIRRRAPRRLIFAFGVAPAETVESLRPFANELIVLVAPRHFFAVGEWYLDFTPTEDAEVLRLLAELAPAAPPPIR